MTNAPSDSFPVGIDLFPDQPSFEEAVQDIALETVQVMFFVVPWMRLSGPVEPFILRSTVGMGTAVTVTDCAPVETFTLFQHSRVKVLVAGMVCPDVPPVLEAQPLQPLEAQQEVVLAVVQVRVDDPPGVTVRGLAEKVRVGAGQRAFEGGADEQAPVQEIVPGLVIPQPLGTELQALP